MGNRFGARGARALFAAAALATVAALGAAPAQGMNGYLSRADVTSFIGSLQSEHGFDLAELERVLGQVVYQPAVVRLIGPERQPTAKAPIRSYPKYRKKFLTPARINAGVQYWEAHEAYLKRAETEFGVPAEVILGIIGVETAYGRNTGSYRVIDALATIAFDGQRRQDYFRSLVTRGARRADPDTQLDELDGLARAAGAHVAARIVQTRTAADPATLIGRGKAEVLAAACASANATVVIFDNDLTPAQARNLEAACGHRVIDRTELILDIFARRARTREGQLQVELAQLQYRLPRLAGSGIELSRLGGGIGTRGPGETKLETDRRRIRHRIAALKSEIAEVKRRRSQLRARRRRSEVPTVALVGYTNAGKTTLFNQLTGADAVTSHALFVTLDPLARRLKLADARQILLSDTVGFIERLPHELVAAFHATLEEVRSADLLVHVIDAAAPDRAASQRRSQSGPPGGRRGARADRRGVQQDRPARCRRVGELAREQTRRRVHQCAPRPGAPGAARRDYRASVDGLRTRPDRTGRVARVAPAPGRRPLSARARGQPHHRRKPGRD